MTDEEMNIAICELRGWLRMMRNGKEVYYDPEGGHVLPHELPNHINGIKALGHMHAAEEILLNADHLLNTYTRELARSMIDSNDGSELGQRIWHATAKQRAEALLRTLGVLKKAQP